ncbi:hypothetical protein HI914_06728 [Erysiphe necator]|nr:hypothetical protein HI914_06728 [Erysiphe necator]
MDLSASDPYLAIRTYSKAESTFDIQFCPSAIIIGPVYYLRSYKAVAEQFQAPKYTNRISISCSKCIKI